MAVDVVSVLGAGAAGVVVGVAVRKAASVLLAAAGLLLLLLFLLENYGFITVNWDALVAAVTGLLDEVLSNFVGFMEKHGVSIGAFIVGAVIGAKL